MRPFNRNSNVGRRGGGNGPVLTEHLRDLDLELELLKRKREMIEKQQSLLNQQQAFNRQSYNYDQPQSYRGQHYDSGPQYSNNSNHNFSSFSRDFSNSDFSSSGCDFSHLYSEPQQSRDNRFPRQSAKKRLGDYVWSEPPAKRPFGPPKKAGPGPSPSSRQSRFIPPSQRPGFGESKNQTSKPGQKFRDRPQRPRPNDFTPTKVTKNKPPLVNKPATNVPKATPSKGDANCPIYHPNMELSPQLAGRMELALGNILKCMKDKYGKVPENAPYFVENNSCRKMKREIRQRIRDAMLNKPIGHIAQIMQIYRDVYPEETDEEILEIGKQKKDFLGKVAKPTTFNMYTDVVNPYNFFKKNYSRLMSVSLNKMFVTLETICKEENAQVSKETICKEESAQVLKAEAEQKDNTEPANTSEEPAKDADETEKPKDDKPEDVAKPTEGVIDVDAEEPKDKVQEESGESKEDANKTNKDADKTIEDADNTIEDADNTKDDANKSHSKVEDEAAKAAAEVIRKKYDTMLDEMMPQQLAFWLPKLKPQFLKVLASDITFVRAKQNIVKQTNERSTMVKEAIAEDGPSKLEEALFSNKPNRLDYHVKIQGRPVLPKKNVMTGFLKQFNPKMIKKLKNVRNLLYVGFDNKEDFDKMVAANGTVIGNAKIIVKISQWVTNSGLDATPNTGAKDATSTPNTSMVSDGDVSMKEVSDESKTELNESLDNQIDELLNSIRNEEDNGDENKEGNENADVEEAPVDQNQDSPNVENNGADTNVDLTEDTPIDGETENNENGNEKAQEETENLEIEAQDKVEELKNDAKETAKGTPTRASTRLASTPNTPSTIRTRRSSKLAQN